MSPHNDKPLAQDAYDALAEAYAAMVDTKPHNAYYERPATLSLLPDVRGKRVLDAGCGPGAYADYLAAQGAIVVAIDANPKMVEFARQRLSGRAQVFQASLDQPLDFLEDGSFDIVVSPLVLDYIRDWRLVFSEFHRLLRPEGWLVFSIGHPFAEFDLHRQASNYFDVDLVEYEWTGFGKRVNMPSYRRPLGEVINPLIQAGFTLDTLLEPLPTPEFKEQLPEDHEKLSRNPGFLCLRAIKKT
ncbi:MAG: class I SAM-dependent methyltransferase [Acidobacteriaceae bacterium]